ncbi:MAG: signal peptidase [Flavobacterium sp. JAD_PAG50586_2]|nr:MAG: signal peptidase [Flavobacterium sp. JAD_PAG50586_2]
MKKLLKFYLLSFVLLSDFLTYAQPGDTDGGGGGLEGGDPEPAPINSKLILLAIAGILFVIYTFRKSEEQA